MRHLFKRLRRSRESRMAMIEADYAAHGQIAFRIQECQECGHAVLTKMTEPAPQDCTRHFTTGKR